MLLSNRKELSADPQNQMGIEEFANVVNMAGDDVSLASASELFDILDTDKGGTISLNEFRINSIQMGMRAARATSRIATDDKLPRERQFNNLTREEKRHVHNLCGLGQVSAAVDRLTSRVESFRQNEDMLKLMKHYADEILTASDFCFLLAATGPPVSATLETPPAMLHLTELKPRPLLKWENLTVSICVSFRYLQLDLTGCTNALHHPAG